MPISFGRFAGIAAIASVGVVGIAGTAFAHIEPDPPAAQEGATVTVGFVVEHGCAGSPTTGLDINLPDGLTDAKAVDKPGWTATVESGVVRFVGQSPSGEQPDTFSVSFTAPATPGEVHFPTVQKCLEGTTDWPDGEQSLPDPEHPAPTMKITAGPPRSDDLTPAPDGNDEATPGVTATTVAPASHNDSNTGLVVGIVIAAVVVIGGGGLFAARARSKHATR